MTGNLAGRKPDDQGKQGRSYLLYDSCDGCPLRVYIDMVCDDDLRALVVYGNPGDDVVEEARGRLLTEFSELSGDSRFGVMNSCLRRMHYYRSNILLLAVCQRLLFLGGKEKVVEYLREQGVGCDGLSREELLSKVSGLIGERKMRLRSEEKRYKKLTDEEKTEKPTRRYFTEQLVELSKYAGFRLTTEISLGEYAAYVRSMKEYVEQLKGRMNVK